MKIAILENNTHDVQLLEEWLQSAGHTSRVFVSGSTFTNELNCDTYDLAIIGSTALDTDGAQKPLVENVFACQLPPGRINASPSP